MSINIHDAVSTLNQLLKMDPAAIESLFNMRMVCGNNLPRHPTITVVTTHSPQPGKGIHQVGFIGILNAIFRDEDDIECGCDEIIVATLNDGHITKFEVFKNGAIQYIEPPKPTVENTLLIEHETDKGEDSVTLSKNQWQLMLRAFHGSTDANYPYEEIEKMTKPEGMPQSEYDDLIALFQRPF
jgi:hypothetical protein